MLLCTNKSFFVAIKSASNAMRSFKVKGDADTSKGISRCPWNNVSKPPLRTKMSVHVAKYEIVRKMNHEMHSMSFCAIYHVISILGLGMDVLSSVAEQQTANDDVRKPLRLDGVSAVSMEETALLLALATPTFHPEQLPLAWDQTQVEAEDLVQDFVIRCVCRKDDDIGFQIQCENCSVWQHGICVGIAGENDAPETYLCDECDPTNHPAINGPVSVVEKGRKKRGGARRKKFMANTLGKDKQESTRSSSATPSMSNRTGKSKIDTDESENGSMSGGNSEEPEDVEGIDMARTRSSRTARQTKASTRLEENLIKDRLPKHENRVLDQDMDDRVDEDEEEDLSKPTSLFNKSKSASPTVEESNSLVDEKKEKEEKEEEEEGEEEDQQSNVSEEPEFNGAGKPVRERKPRQIPNMVRYEPTKSDAFRVTAINTKKRKAQNISVNGTHVAATATSEKGRKTGGVGAFELIPGKVYNNRVYVRKKFKTANGHADVSGDKNMERSQSTSSARGNSFASNRVASAKLYGGRSASTRYANNMNGRDDGDDHSESQEDGLAQPSFKPRSVPVRSSVMEMQRRVKEMIRFAAGVQLEISQQSYDPNWNDETEENEDGVSDTCINQDDSRRSTKERREELIRAMQDMIRGAMNWQQRWDPSFSGTTDPF